MAGDFNKPAVSEAYATTFTSARDMASDLAKQLDATGTLNPPTGAKRWNATSRYWEVNNGTPASPSWGKMVDDASTRYEIRVWKADQLNASQNFSITGDASSNTVAFNGTGAVQLTLTLGTIPATKGGTGQTTWTTGQLLYASAADTLAKLSVGTVGQVLRSTGTLPAWSALVNGDLPATFSSKTLDNTNTATLLDNQFTLQDQTTPTKQAQFDCAGITAATTRTYTLPDANGTFLLADMSQTITNKTFSSGNTWNGNGISVQYGGTGAGTFTIGGLLTGNGTSAVNATAISGVVFGNGALVPTAATALQIANAIGTQAVTNATNLNGSGTISDTTTVAATGQKVGYRNVPGNTQSTSYTLALTDVGKSIDTTAGVTVPANATVAFAVGDTISITNTSGSNITITQATDVTLRQAGTANTGNRTLAQYGVATVRKIATDTWTIAGAGVS